MKTISDYLIFGRHIRLHFNQGLTPKYLESELSIYPAPSAKSQPDIEIHYDDIITPHQGLANPSSHITGEDGFIAYIGSLKEQFLFEDNHLKKIVFQLARHSIPNWRAILWKIRNMQFTTLEESLGQLFHEFVLIPAMFFDEQQFLIHAAAVQSVDDEIILIGGTGGVGKTSLEMELCHKHNYRFVADDISVIDNDGHVWPNLAYPKIYAYNLIDNSIMKQKILGGRDIFDKLHWHIHAKRGLSKVRRRISPEDLYNRFSTHGEKISRYYILAREERSDLFVEAIDGKTAAELSVLVMNAEYIAFHNHLLWETYNRQLRNQSPTLRLSALLERWQRQASQIFSQVPCYVIRIPISMKHTRIKQELADILLKTETR